MSLFLYLYYCFTIIFLQSFIHAVFLVANGPWVCNNNKKLHTACIFRMQVKMYHSECFWIILKMDNIHHFLSSDSHVQTAKNPQKKLRLLSGPPNLFLVRQSTFVMRWITSSWRPGFKNQLCNLLSCPERINHPTPYRKVGANKM